MDRKSNIGPFVEIGWVSILRATLIPQQFSLVCVLVSDARWWILHRFWLAKDLSLCETVSSAEGILLSV